MIVDCFTFYNELGILKKRLRYLSAKVDKFVLVESTVTHKGNPKKLYYKDNRDEFTEWNDKIEYVLVSDNPTVEDPWSRENHQRNCIQRGLDRLGLRSDDIVMISDVDEIPDLRFVGNIPIGHETVTAHMYAFEYSFDFMQTREPWFGTVMTRYGKMQNPQHYRDKRWHFPFCQNAGWHLSSFGDADFVYNKITNFAHCNDENNKEFSIDKCKEYVKNGLNSDGTIQNTKTPKEILDIIPNVIKN